MPVYQIASRTMTVLVKTDETGKIIDAAPIVKRFIGQRVQSLLAWLVRLDGERGVIMTRLDDGKARNHDHD